MQYKLRGITSDEVNREVARLMEELRTDANLRQEAAKSGIDLIELDRSLGDQGVKDVISIQPSGAGVDPATVAIIVAFAPVAARITQDLWTHFMLPWLKREFGRDAITPLE